MPNWTRIEPDETVFEGESIKWDNPKVVEGQLISVGEEKDAMGNPIGILLNINHEEQTFYLPQGLRALLDKINPNEHVRIEYKGSTPTKKGHSYKLFDVFVDV